MADQEVAQTVVCAREDLRLSLTPDRREELKRYIDQRLGDKTIAKLMGITRESVSYHRRITFKVRRDPAFFQRPMPEDFLAEAPKLLLVEAAQRWSASDHTIRRWHQEAGTTPRPRFLPKAAPMRPAPRQTVRSPFVGATVPPVPARVPDQAAHYLRRHYPQVCRARTLEGKGPDGVWIVGNMRVNEDRLVKMAEKLGFDPRGCLG